MRKRKMIEFETFLREEEKSTVTIEKYMRDVNAFLAWQGRRRLDKTLMIQWKESLLSAGYKVRSINSMLASVNAWLRFLKKTDCRVRNLKLQHQVYCSPELELKKTDYEKLLKAAEKKPRLYVLMQTICCTGIRVSELRFFTVEAVKAGEVVVRCKAKTRPILLTGKIRKLLLAYAKSCHIQQGCIFCTRSGKPLDRSNIWAEMKKLCDEAGVTPEKVFPHNLRKLFARIYYRSYRDLAKLADILGHSSLNTTRIYIMSTGEEHRKQLEVVNFVYECANFG